MWTQDRSGQRANVALGFSALSRYANKPSHYFGAVIGRYANRIAGGRFELDGATYERVRNDGANSLHGGPRGFDKHVWTISAATAATEAARVVFRHTSRHLEMVYPGTTQIEATYTTVSAGSLRSPTRALILDCDGVLAETERSVHLRARAEVDDDCSRLHPRRARCAPRYASRSHR